MNVLALLFLVGFLSTVRFSYGDYGGWANARATFYGGGDASGTMGPKEINQVLPNTGNPTIYLWCVVVPELKRTVLQAALVSACSLEQQDCQEIKPGGTCFLPDTLESHLSYVLNSRFIRDPSESACSFGGVGLVTTTDPSHGSCLFQSTIQLPPNDDNKFVKIGFLIFFIVLSLSLLSWRVYVRFRGVRVGPEVELGMVGGG